MIEFSNMVVISNDEFGKGLAQALGAQFLAIEKRVFADGETCPRISDMEQIKGRNVILVNRMSLPIDPNRYLVENLLLLGTLSQAQNVGIVLPYLIYSRQDRAFRPGEPVSLRAVFELLKAAGATEIFTVSSHAERDKPMLSAPIPVHNINGFEAIADYFAVKKLQKPLVVAPDKKATGAATLIAEKLGAEVCSMEKTRNLETGEIEHASFDAELSGRDVIIIDDIIASGKTMFGAIELIKKGRPHKVWCACVHLVMESGIEQVMKVADELVATDTIATPFSKTSVVPLLAKRIGKVIN